jgi:hypothetical protein
MTAQPERYLMPFDEPGQTLNLADIQTLKLGEAGSTQGIVWMRIQTEWPGGAFTAVAFGDLELVNEAPYCAYSNSLGTGWWRMRMAASFAAARSTCFRWNDLSQFHLTFRRQDNTNLAAFPFVNTQWVILADPLAPAMQCMATI